MFENLLPSHARSGDGYSWRRLHENDPRMSRKPGYTGRYAKHMNPQRLQVNSPASNFKTRQRDGGVAKEVDQAPTARKTRSVAANDGIVRDSHKAPKGVSVRKHSRAVKNAAAARIQHAFRGYYVRKSDPLKHLRIIHKVRGELEELVRKMAEPEQFRKLCSDPQERLKWTEGVMALLLKLDSIQGANPVVREVRKSVTKELILLQEILDSTAGVSLRQDDRDDKGLVKESDGNKEREEANNVRNGKLEVEPEVSGLHVMTNDRCEHLGKGEAEKELRLGGTENLLKSDVVSSSSDFMERDSGVMEEGKVVADDVQGIEEIDAGDSRLEHRLTQIELPDDAEIDTTMSASTSPFYSADGTLSPSSEPDMKDSHGVELSPAHEEQNHAVAAVEIVEQDQPRGPLSTELEGEATEMNLEEERDGYSEANEPYEFSTTHPDSHELAYCARDDQNVKRKEKPSIIPHQSDANAEKACMQEHVGETCSVLEAGDVPAVEESLQEETKVAEEQKEKANRQRGEREMEFTPSNLAPQHHRQGEKLNNSVAHFVEDQEVDTSAAKNLDTAVVARASAPWESQNLFQVGQPVSLLQPQTGVTGQSVPSTSGDGALAERQTMHQVLEDNRKLKAVIGEVVQWAKQQDDIIHNLATRIEQLEGKANLAKNAPHDSKNRIKSTSGQTLLS